MDLAYSPSSVSKVRPQKSADRPEYQGMTAVLQLPLHEPRFVGWQRTARRAGSHQGARASAHIPPREERRTIPSLRGPLRWHTTVKFAPVPGADARHYIGGEKPVCLPCTL